jgi:hypothetical protein
MTGEDANVKKRTVSSDSYMVDVYQPVLKAGDRKLMYREGTVDESLLDHLQGGGGIIGARFTPA